MKRKLLLFASLLLVSATIQVNAQITLLQDYTNNNSATIGKFQGVTFKEAGFSGLFPIPGTNGKEFWTTSDRGVNVDAGNANPSGCRPVYDKIYGFANYAPKIHRIRIDGDSIQILKSITIKRPNGTDATGLLNPTGFGSIATEIPYSDTVLDCSRISLKANNKDIWGIDAEGIAVDKNGNFWLCEEGGPTVWKLNSNGVVTARYSPYAKQVGAESQDVYIDSAFKYRKNNRGFEGLTITPNGKVYAIIQSPLLYPTKTVGEGTRVHRILEIDPATGAQKMYAYLNDGIIGASGSNQIRLRDWKIGDMAALNDSVFLVLEAALRGTTDIKKLYQINIKNATVVNSGLYSTKTLEALVDSVGLQANSIVPVKKTLVMNLLTNNWPAVLEKAEGLAILNDSTIAICNDNDYGTTTPLVSGVPAENGIAVATGIKSHLLTYRLSGANKLKNFKTFATQFNKGITGLQSSQSPYMTPALAGVKFTSLLTAGDAVNGYKMAGLGDGLGAFDNGNGTFTLLMNHEISNSLGVNRAHGAKGAFVSKWVINKSDLKINSGEDLIKNINLYNGSGYTTYNQGSTTALAALNRLCAADLPEVSAFYNTKTGLGTQERIFMNGEEAGTEGRAFAHIATGTNAGNSWELPYLGKFSWENAVASPASGDKTVVVGLDDVTGGQVYFYVGNKTNTGTEIEKAGLTNGKLYGVAVAGLTTELSTGFPAANTAFTLTDVGNIKDSTGNVLNNRSIALGITSFLRPEDGSWDPKNPNDFYFATTNSFTAPSRLWRLRFADITKPENGGTITAVLDGTEGQKMLDNMTIDNYGHVLLQEDPGGQTHYAKVWQYTIATDQLTLLASHDTTRFTPGGSQFLTIDEESSGIIDMENILGKGNFILYDQAHYGISGEVVEGGQLLMMYNPTMKNQELGATNYSSDAPYLKSPIKNAKYTAMLTAGDAINGYKFNGLPDGMGAFDNNNGTFTLLVAHEIGSTIGATRAHGSMGAYVSKWTINKSDLSFVSGSDLIRKVNIWNPLTNSFVAYNSSFPSLSAAFGRFCSADLPSVSAFYNSKTGLGTQERIFMCGEEVGTEGRAFAHIATGTNAGTSWELPYLGKFAWENAVACPSTGDKTLVAGLDDGTGGQVYFYIGTKTNSGNEIDKAGLNNGKLFGVAVTGLATEVSASVPTANTAFSLVDMGVVNTITGATLNTNSVTKGVTTFLRPEDGAWDPSSPSDFYFATTNAFNSPSRVWKLKFTDITKPELGGTITAVLDGTEGPQMIDNLTIDRSGKIHLQEDPGNQTYIAKQWQYDIAKDSLTLAGYFDSSKFLPGAETFYTQDEESSGIIDVQEILGPGMFLVAAQAHYPVAGEQVEGGQLLAFYNPLIAKLNPEANVQSNSINIVNNDITPASTDNTDFGTITTGASVSKSFVIQNTGVGDLKISNISFAGLNPTDFTITNTLTFPTSIAPSSSLSLNVKFMPSAAGIKKADLVIDNNDADENTYKFALQGNSETSDINVMGNTFSILDGDSMPSLDDNSDFGYVFVGANKTQTFKIQNKGTSTLFVSGISFTGTNASEFTLQNNLTFPLAVFAGSTETFQVTFAPLNTGIRTASVVINNNDFDELVYDFKVRGLAVSSLNLKSNFIKAAKLAPNPSNNSTTLSLDLPTAQKLTIQVLNNQGQVVSTILNAATVEGKQNLVVNTATLSNGLYFIEVNNGTSKEIFKLVVNH